MPWGNQHEAYNQKGQPKAKKKAVRKIQADVNAEAKRRVVKIRKTGKYDGNSGTR